MTAVSFCFHEHDCDLSGQICLYSPIVENARIYRTGSISLQNGKQAEIILTHSRATSEFIYLKKIPLSPSYLALFNLGFDERYPKTIEVPGQLIFGTQRQDLVSEGILDVLQSPAAQATALSLSQDEMIVVPILREGIKYQIVDGLFRLFGHYCNEIVTDPHHVLDQNVPIYGRRVCLTIFKDKDLTKEQKSNVRVAWIGDSIASGNILLNLLDKLDSQFPNLERVECIAPFATIRGITRLLHAWRFPFVFRVHLFETILNALPPDFYYSAHFADPAYHIRPDLEERVRMWWGQDERGQAIADTACAGYGWSEAFFSPKKQIRMIDQQLVQRHQMTIAMILQQRLSSFTIR